MVAATEHMLASGGDARQPHRSGHGFGAGLQEPYAFEPRDPHGEHIGQLFLEHRRQRTHDARGDRLLGRAAHGGVSVPERHGPERHDVVDILAAPGVPDAAPGRTQHPLREARVLARLATRRPEQGVGTLTPGRRESRNAPVAHRT